MVRELRQCDAQSGSQEDEAAILLGASGWQMPRDVAEYSAGATYGVVLTNARAIGEFGGVSGVRLDSRRKRYRHRYRLNY